MSSRFFNFFCLVLLLGAASTVLLESQATHDEKIVATYSRGALHAGIPYRAPHAGAGQLVLEVLDPEVDREDQQQGDEAPLRDEVADSVRPVHGRPGDRSACHRL